MKHILKQILTIGIILVSFSGTAQAAKNNNCDIATAFAEKAWKHEIAGMPLTEKQVESAVGQVDSSTPEGVLTIRLMRKAFKDVRLYDSVSAINWVVVQECYNNKLNETSTAVQADTCPNNYDNENWSKVVGEDKFIKWVKLRDQKKTGMTKQCIYGTEGSVWTMIKGAEVSVWTITVGAKDYCRIEIVVDPNGRVHPTYGVWVL